MTESALRKGTMMSIEDKLAIQEIIAQYSYTYDGKDAEGFTGRFTSRHYQSGLLFDELTSDSALTRTMVLVTHQGVAEATPRPIISGVYHDQWRKTHTGWRLAHRAAHVDGDPGFSK